MKMKPDTERRIDQVIPLILKNPSKTIKDYPTDPEVIRRHVWNLVFVSAFFINMFSDMPEEEHKTIFIKGYQSIRTNHKIYLNPQVFNEVYSIAKAEAINFELI